MFARIVDLNGTDTAYEAMTMSFKQKKKYVNEKHKYSISEHKKNNGTTEYRTTYYDKSGKRHNLCRRNLDELYEQLFIFYRFGVSNERSVTLNDIMEEAFTYHQLRGGCTDATIKHYRNSCRRFLRELGAIPLNQLSQDIVIQEVRDSIKKAEKPTTKKALQDLRAALNIISRYAMIKRYIFNSLVADDFSATLDRECSYAECKREAMTQNEYLEYKAFLWKALDVEKKPKSDITLLGLLFSCCKGVRVAEVAGLMWRDLIDEKHIHLTHQIDEAGELLDTTKEQRRKHRSNCTENGRILLRVSEVDKILKLAEEYAAANQIESDFVFSIKTNEPPKKKAFTDRMRKICKKLNIEHTGLHAVRKAYSTFVDINISKEDFSEADQAKELGHSIETHRRHYISTSLYEREDDIVAAFDELYDKRYHKGASKYHNIYEFKKSPQPAKVKDS